MLKSFLKKKDAKPIQELSTYIYFLIYIDDLNFILSNSIV